MIFTFLDEILLLQCFKTMLLFNSKKEKLWKIDSMTLPLLVAFSVYLLIVFHLSFLKTKGRKGKFASSLNYVEVSSLDKEFTGHDPILNNYHPDYWPNTTSNTSLPTPK